MWQGLTREMAGITEDGGRFQSKNIFFKNSALQKKRLQYLLNIWVEIIQKFTTVDFYHFFFSLCIPTYFKDLSNLLASIFLGIADERWNAK